MCGRYACKIQPLGRWSAVFRVWIEELADRYNIAPTAVIPVFTADGWRWMRWGLVPAWSREPSVKYSTFNARAESLREKPAFKNAWRKARRCLVPSLGYYEWQQVPSGKQPYFIRSREDEPLVFAGLWDYWNKEGREIISCSIITMEAGGELKEIHRRMPLLLEPESAMAWLKGSCQEAEGILESPPDVEVMFYPVDPAVGNVRNKGEGLIKPV